MKKSGRKTERWKRALALCLCSVLFISGLHGTYSTRANDEFGDGGGVDGLNSEFGSGDGQMSVEPEATETPTATPTEIPTEMPTATPTETLMEPEVTPAGPAVLTYSDLAMNVEVTEVNGGSIQEGTTVSFDAVQADDTAYTAAVNMLNEKAAKENREVKSLLAYKLSLADASGTELDIPVNVKVTYISPADMENPELAKADIKAVSWRLDEAQNLTVTDLNAKISSTENKAIETAEFKMDKPGVIAFDWEAEKTAVEPEPTETPDGTEAAPTPTPESTENPDGTEVTLTPTPETPENPDGTEAAPTPTPESTEIPDGTEVPPLTPEPEPTETPDETEATPTPTETPDETEVTPIPTPEIETQKQIEITVDEVNIRAAASVEAESIGKEVKGTRLILLDTEQDADGTLWYKIDYNGVEAYVRADTASVILAEETEDDTADDGENEPDNNKEEIPQITEVKITAESANIHAEASTESDVLGTAAAEATFQLTETITGEDGTATWYAIVYNEATGYVEAANAEVVEAAPAVITRYDYKSDDVNVLVTLTNPEDLPDDAELVVTPVELSVEAEENVTEEAIKEEKAIEKIIAYDIKFVHPDPENPDKKIEVQPGATVQVSVTVPEIKAGQEAAVYHVDDADQVENMDGAVDKKGDVVFETTHFSIYVIVQQGKNEVEVKIEHLYKNGNEIQKIYSDDNLTLPVGGKINKYAKATNWNVSEVYVGNKTEKEKNPEEIIASSDTTVKVYYTPKVTISPDNPVTFYDYTVKADGYNSGDQGINSINMPDCYEDGYVVENPKGKLIVGNTSNNYIDYRHTVFVGGTRYNANGNKTSVSNVNANLYQDKNKNVAATELLSHVDGEEVYFNYQNPGFFTNSDRTVDVTVKNGKNQTTETRYLRKVYKNYSLEFARSGDKWTLNAAYNGTKKVSDAGNGFWPLDNVKPTYESRTNDNLVSNNQGDHNNYFGMRYDIPFSLGDYVGDLNYKFTGDDDLWVVLDGDTVVIDLGGIHDALTAEVDLWDHLLTDEQKKLKEAGDDSWMTELTLEQKAEEHTLTVLYMERGSYASNCHMEFTVPNATIAEVTKVPMTDLEIKKVNKKNEGLPGARFTLTNDTTGDAQTASSLSDGTVKFTGLREGTYTLTEDQAPSNYIPMNGNLKVKVVATSDTTAKATLYNEDESEYSKKVDGKYAIVNQLKGIDESLAYNKTAHVSNWDDRTYDITISASSKVTEETQEYTPSDVMMVLDTSGSMLYYDEDEEEHNDKDGFREVGIYENVKNSLNPNKVYYLGNGTTKISYSENNEGPWEYTNAKQPMIYIDGKWQYYTGSYWTSNIVTQYRKGKPSEPKVYTIDSSLTGLKEAAISFADGIAANPQNQLGIVSFNYQMQTVKGLSQVSDSADTAKKIAQMHAIGATRPQLGLQEAYNSLINSANENKVVVLFSDGAPSTDADKTNSVAQAKKLKDAGVTIYTVGLGLSNSTAEWLSSEIATSSDHAYTASNVDELKKIFRQIQNQIITTDIKAQVIDYIAPEFVILDDAGNQITADYPGIEENGILLSNGGTVKYSADGKQYIVWDDQTIGGEDWERTIRVQARGDYIGGNNVATNISPSSVINTIYGNAVLPLPHVNVKTNLLIDDKEVTVYKGDAVPTERDILNKLFDAETLSSKYKISSDKFTMQWYEVTRTNGTETPELTPVTVEEMKQMKMKDASKEFRLEVTYDTGLPTAESNANTDNNTAGTKASDSEPYKETAKNKNNPEQLYGTYTVNVISGQIQIQKKLAASAEENQTFKFGIFKQDSEGTIPDKPMETVSITVPHGQTSMESEPFGGLERGTYVVREIAADEYDLKGIEEGQDTNCYSELKSEEEEIHFVMGNHKDTKQDVISTEYAYTGGGVLGKVIFTNQKAVKKWEIVKVSKTSSNLTVPGAGFTLTNKDDKTKYYTGVSGDDGVVVWKNAEQKEVTKMPEGTYTLEETAAPTGYMRSTETWEIKINSKGSIESVTSRDGNPVVPTKKGETDIWQYQFANEAVYDLPSAGGTGIYWYTISGTLFMMAAALILYKNRCRETVKK